MSASTTHRQFTGSVRPAAAQEHDAPTVGRHDDVARLAECVALGPGELAGERFGGFVGHRTYGTTRILAWTSGWPRSVERLGDAVDGDRAGDQRAQVDLALGDRAQRLGELVGLVAEGELDVELSPDADHRVDLVGLHAHADDQDAESLGAIRIAASIIPGTPTASKMTSGRVPSTSRQAIDGRPLGGVDDDVAPEVLGQRPPPGEKSAPTTGPIPRRFSSAMQASPTGPRPSTIAAPGRDPALRHGVDADGERLGQRGQVRREAGGHLDGEHLVEHHQLGVAAGVAVGEPDRVDAVGVERRRHADHHVADASRSTPGPVSTTSQQNSWPITIGASGSNMIGRNGSGGSAGGELLGEPPGHSSPWRRRWRSLPQMPQASTLVSTWPGPGSGSAMSSTRSFQSCITTARIGRA